MISRLRQLLPSIRKRDEADEREKMARLEWAEGELSALQVRKDRALGILAARDSRNHWRESIEQMIQGVS